jgi:uncharacterized protein (DUF2147 family)
MKMPQAPSPNDPASRRRLALAAIATVPFTAASWPAKAAKSPATPAQLIGNWRAIDAESETAYAIVEFVQTSSGTLSGFVRTLLQGAEQPAPAQTCDRCTGARKGAPFIGMEVIWNLRPEGERFVDGSVIEPDSGRIFRCRVRVIDRGERMDLTVYERFAIFGFTERWVRTDANH